MSAGVIQAQQSTIRDYTRQLHLPTVGGQFLKLAEEAIQQKQGHVAFLEVLLRTEMEERERNAIARRILEAKFPKVKTLEEFKFEEAPQIPAAQIRNLAEGGYLERSEPIILLGDTGTGKTHLASGLGVEACRQRKRVRFTTAAELVNELIEAKNKSELNRITSRWMRYELIVIDEMAYCSDAGISGGDAVSGDQPTCRKGGGDRDDESAVFRVDHDVSECAVMQSDGGPVGFTHATLEDFDDNQIADFLIKWHDAAKNNPSDRTRLQSRLTAALQESQPISELAGNPLLLTMMAILNRNQDLPRDRVELYAQASRVLLHEWDASRSLPVDTFARQEKEELLRQLAGDMLQREGGVAGNLIERPRLVGIFRTFLNSLGVPDSHNKATSLVKQLMERNFILCFAGADRFSFVHRTFLEYFCAAWFVERFQRKQTLTLQQLKNDVFGRHWHDESWHEILRLIAGMVGERQAEELIRFLLEQDGRHYKLANLILAAECLGEIRNRGLTHTTDQVVRKNLEKALRYDPPYYYSPHQEYSEVGTTRERAVELTLIARIWRSETTRHWLEREIETNNDWIVRSAAIQELSRGWKTYSETLPIVKNVAQSEEDDRVRGTALFELAGGWPDDAETLPLLKKSARSDKDSDVRALGIRELAQGWKDDPETPSILKQCAQLDRDSDVRV